MANFTLTDISGALSRVLDVPPGHPAVARFAGQLEAFVNGNPDLQRSGLGGSGFQSMAMSNLPPEVADLMNPTKVQEIQRQQAERANVTSSDAAAFSKLGITALGDRATAGTTGRSAERASSASFDSIGANGNWNTPAGMAQMRDYALQKGVSWAANNPEILKLGPAAIDVLARTGLRKEVYTGLTKDAGLSSKGAIGIADILHKNGKDPNTAGEEVKKNLIDINNQAYTHAVDELGKVQMNPNATEEQKQAARERTRQTGEEAGKADPTKAELVRRNNELMGVAVQKNDASHKVEKSQEKLTATQSASTATQTASTQAATEVRVGALSAINGASTTPPVSNRPANGSPPRPAGATP